MPDVKSDSPMPSSLSCPRRIVTSPSVYAMIGLLLVGTVVAHWLATNGGLAPLREGLGLAAPLVTVPIHIVIAITPFPSDVISIANGAFYGFSLGVGLSWLAWWIAALLEFGLGYRVRKDSPCAVNFGRSGGKQQG